MSDSSKVPTGPWCWYRDEDDPREQIAMVFLIEPDGRVHYSTMLGTTYDEMNTKWLGPVPMPGEWVPRGYADALVHEIMRTHEHQRRLPVDLLDVVDKWMKANPAPPVSERVIPFTIDPEDLT